MNRCLTLTLACVLSVGVRGWTEEKKDAAVDRTRKQVQMLDDLYKTAVVLITEHYVKDENTLAAGEAAQALFAAMKKKGWHEVRLLDVAGEPIKSSNVAQDGFEKDAIAQLKAGKSFVEKVETKAGKRVFRAATPIPVVHKKCILCHPNYEKVPAGAPIGALGYTVAIE